ncbi:hypothetical protein P9D43_17220 [Neobacillus niacini]|nr:hypothetical protein [Neobacillus niacini]MEC1523748.1 hypothetical protein [Neobacillus niacini]
MMVKLISVKWYASTLPKSMFTHGFGQVNRKSTIKVNKAFC